MVVMGREGGCTAYTGAADPPWRPISPGGRHVAGLSGPAARLLWLILGLSTNQPRDR